MCCCHHRATSPKSAENISAVTQQLPSDILTTSAAPLRSLLRYLQLSPLHHLQCPQVPVAAAARSGLRVKKASLPVLHLGFHPFTSSSWLHLQPLPPVLPSLCPTISVRPFRPFLPSLCLHVAVVPPARSICNSLPSFSLLGPLHRCGPSPDSSSSLHSFASHTFFWQSSAVLGQSKLLRRQLF